MYGVHVYVMHARLLAGCPLRLILITFQRY